MRKIFSMIFILIFNFLFLFSFGFSETEPLLIEDLNKLSKNQKLNSDNFEQVNEETFTETQPLTQNELNEISRGVETVLLSEDEVIEISRSIDNNLDGESNNDSLVTNNDLDGESSKKLNIYLISFVIVSIFGILGIYFYFRSKNENKVEKFNQKIQFSILFLVVALFFIPNSYADSNGVWHKASDVRAGIFGSDEGGGDFYFPSGVSVNELYINGTEISVSTTGEILVNNISQNVTNVLNQYFATNNNIITPWTEDVFGITYTNGFVFTNSMFAGIFYDWDNANYYVNPSANSKLKSLDVESINVDNLILDGENITIVNGEILIDGDKQNLTQVINQYFNSTNNNNSFSQWEDESNGISYTSGYVYTDSMFAGILYDWDNANYYANPSATSKFKDLDVESVSINGEGITIVNGEILIDGDKQNLTQVITQYFNTTSITNGLSHWKNESNGISYTDGYTFTDYMFAGILYDWDNANYYVNPSATSKIKNLTIESGNVVSNCQVIVELNSGLLTCPANLRAQSSKFDNGQWELTCCKNN